jgi:enoyl-CoA hydratase
MEAPVTETDEIVCERQGAAGVVTLNRPRALNALTLGMVRAMRKSLDAWAQDPAVTRIVVQGSGDRAFCAGGDIRRLYDLGRAGQHAEALTFWREEYQLNVRIQSYPKPYVSLIDGIVMGGGVGVSLHGSHRVAGDHYVFAMPEVGIGFFPDVGASYALPRLPGWTGTFIALTGERLRTADAVALGLATAAVPSDRLSDLRDALFADEPVDATISTFARDPGPAPLATSRPVIDDCFSGETLQEILRRLDRAAGTSELARNVAESIRTKSPTSLAIALEQMRRGAALAFAEAMRMEFRIVSRIAHGHDFYEGVRATLIDKGARPHWTPATIDAVDPAAIAVHFSPLDVELEVP